ncbi:7245_t:CDS:2, partial [Gigaspora margarita]
PDKPISSTVAVMSSHVKRCAKIPLEVHQHLDISSDESIIPSMSASNCSIATIKTNHFFSPPLP